MIPRRRHPGGVSSWRNSISSNKTIVVIVTILIVLTIVKCVSMMQEANVEHPQLALDVTSLSSAPQSIRGTSSSTTTTWSAWRSHTQEACQKILDSTNNLQILLNEKQKMERQAIAALQQQQQKVPTSESAVVYATGCKHALIDLGTNIGDSIGHYVNQALDSGCGGELLKKKAGSMKIPRPVLDVTTLEIKHVSQNPNPLVILLKAYLPVENDDDNICVHGMEGNPEFTKRLKTLQRYVMDGLSPRPLKHLHIHTESVITEKDGPTKLYLDKHSVENNFWGSSILKSQQDVQKSAKDNNGDVVAADVEGITLSTLVRNINLAPGGTLVIKMDVEGAEYSVLKEVAASNIFCEQNRFGKVIMIVEWHNNSITDPKERQSNQNGTREAKQKLIACGVEFADLKAHWK